MPRPVSPKPIERSYERELVDFLKAIEEQINKKLISQLSRLAKKFESKRPDNIKNDSDPSDDILSIMDEIRLALERDYTDVEIRRMAEKQGLTVAQFNEKLMKNNYKRVLGFDIFLSQPYLKSELNMFSSLNSRLIVGMRDEILNRVEKNVMSGFSLGVRHEEIAKDLMAYIDPLKGTVRNRARLIARDQISKLNSQLNQLRQNELGVTRYIWRSALDEKVRDSHRANDGKTFSWDDPPSETGNPGDDIQCRCWAEPVLSDLLDTAASPDQESEEE